MDKVRGGVFSGAILLAGLSATLISGLIAVGIRQVTLTPSRPLQVHIQPASGQVAIPEATSSPAPRVHGLPSRPEVSPAMVSGPRTRATTATTTGSRSSGGTVTKPAPTTASTPATAPAASASPSPSTPGKGKGNANGQANGNGNGHKH
jgi:hypothetical protein